MPELYVYAELLLHIRQLTLYASLSEDKDKGTQILISSDKKVITAVYGDEKASIYLPTQIKGTANVTFPLGKRTEFSTKLQIDDQNELQHAIETSSEIQVPWTATSLQPGVQLHCKACSAVVVGEGVISQWKDLPSENWAELMDLWFCHKPHEHDHDHDDTKAAAASKGFADQSKVLNEPGTGMVDSLSFLFHGDDSKAIQVSTSSFLERGEKKEAHHITLMNPLVMPLIQPPQIKSSSEDLCQLPSQDGRPNPLDGLFLTPCTFRLCLFPRL